MPLTDRYERWAAGSASSLTGTHSGQKQTCQPLRVQAEGAGGPQGHAGGCIWCNHKRVPKSGLTWRADRTNNARGILGKPAFGGGGVRCRSPNFRRGVPILGLLPLHRPKASTRRAPPPLVSLPGSIVPIPVGSNTEMGVKRPNPLQREGGCHNGRASVPVGTSGCTHRFEFRFELTGKSPSAVEKYCWMVTVCSQVLLLPLGILPMLALACWGDGVLGGGGGE